MSETLAGQDLDISGRIRGILSEHISPSPCKPEEITEDMTLESDLTVDSLDLIELALAIESEFDIECFHEDLTEAATVGDLIDFVTAEITEKERAHG